MLAWFFFGVATLVVGSELLIGRALVIARAFGITERVIGLTLVALGTSLPELATSLVAAIKKQPDIAVGNVVGSNLFNILLIPAVLGVIQPLEVIAATATLDVVLLLALTVLMLLLLLGNYHLTRWKGAVLVSCAALYLLSLFYESM